MDFIYPTDVDASPPLPLGVCASLACLWEATAAKPGNVYRGADFADLTFADFVTSAAVIGPIIERAPETGVGGTVLAGVRATRQAVATNSNLGMLLLMAPLAAVPRDQDSPAGVSRVLAALTHDDTRLVYEAIRVAAPGGLGKVDEADVNAPRPPELTLREAMQLAADRDLVARQYVNNFAEVLWTADRIEEHARRMPLGAAIVRGFLELLAAEPDSLIARKCGAEIADDAARGAQLVLDVGDEAFAAAVADFDFWLRSDGHRRNPGTSADVVAAALFVLLRDGRLDWPVRFYEAN